MPNIDDYFPSKYLKASDIPPGTSVPLVISHVQPEELDADDGRKEMKAVLYFQGKQKGLVLNITNKNVLADNLGQDYSTWSGQRVNLINTPGEFRGRVVNTLRLRFDPGGPLAAPAAAPAATPAEPAAPAPAAPAAAEAPAPDGPHKPVEADDIPF